MKALIDRLIKLDSPDRGVDADLFITLEEPTWHTSHKDLGSVAADKKYFLPDGKLKFITTKSRKAPLYTSSLDVTVALANKVLPNWRWGIHHHGGLIRTYVSKTSPLRPIPIYADHKLPAVALCIAILRAKEDWSKNGI